MAGLTKASLCRPLLMGFPARWPCFLHSTSPPRRGPDRSCPFKVSQHHLSLFSGSTVTDQHECKESGKDPKKQVTILTILNEQASLEFFRTWCVKLFGLEIYCPL